MLGNVDMDQPKFYEDLAKELADLLSGERHWMANAANTSALLFLRLSPAMRHRIPRWLCRSGIRIVCWGCWTSTAPTCIDLMRRMVLVWNGSSPFIATPPISACQRCPARRASSEEPQKLGSAPAKSL